MTHMTRTVRILALALLLALPATSEAGPPLICHPFQTGDAAVLPWGNGAGWNSPLRGYDVQRLTGDTMRLLTADAPVLVRMENLRRATIYAAQDAAVANQLLAAVLARTQASSATGTPDAIALFDAGYLIESYKQAVSIHRSDMLSGEKSRWTLRQEPSEDGYALVVRALALTKGQPEMEYAASLMRQGAAAAEHLRRAQAGATPGSLLARNLDR